MNNKVIGTIAILALVVSMVNLTFLLLPTNQNTESSDVEARFRADDMQLEVTNILSARGKLGVCWLYTENQTEINGILASASNITFVDVNESTFIDVVSENYEAVVSRLHNTFYTSFTDYGNVTNNRYNVINYRCTP